MGGYKENGNEEGRSSSDQLCHVLVESSVRKADKVVDVICRFFAKYFLLVRRSK